ERVPAPGPAATGPEPARAPVGAPRNRRIADKVSPARLPGKTQPSRVPSASPLRHLIGAKTSGGASSVKPRSPEGRRRRGLDGFRPGANNPAPGDGRATRSQETA